jgi:hypothetical protein
VNQLGLVAVDVRVEDINIIRAVLSYRNYPLYHIEHHPTLAGVKAEHILHQWAYLAGVIQLDAFCWLQRLAAHWALTDIALSQAFLVEEVSTGELDTVVGGVHILKAYGAGLLGLHGDKVDVAEVLVVVHVTAEVGAGEPLGCLEAASVGTSTSSAESNRTP